MRPLIRRIVGWLGLDRNPLRRGSDRVEGALRLALVLAFLIGGPLLALSAGRLTRASGLREVRLERTWRHVDAVITKQVPESNSPYGAMTTTWAPGKWTLASGRVVTGLVPTVAGAATGTVVGVWLDGAGRVSSQPPLSSADVLLRTVAAEVCTLAGVGVAAFCIGAWIRWLLNRRRLARWAMEWALVGPRWTTRR